MTVPFHAMHNHEGLYSFVGDDNEQIHVATERLYAWVQKRKHRLEIFETPVIPTLALKFIRDNSVDKKRATEILKDFQNIQPVIFGKTGTQSNGRPDMYLIDGRHRYMCHVYLKLPLIKCYILELKQWHKFLVTGVPMITKEMLAAMPIKPRGYRA